MIKKILKISAFVLFILVLGFAYYYFFFARHTTTAGTTTQTTTPTNYFPFGEGGTATTTAGGTNNSLSQTTSATPTAGDYLSKLRLISNEPVAGATFIYLSSATSTGSYIRYMQKATGHIFDVSVTSNTVNQISNTTIPKIYQAYFVNNGAGVIGRYLGTDNQTIKTFYAPVASTTVGTFLPDNIAQLAANSSSKIFYLTTTVNGSAGIIATDDGSKGSQVWTSPLTELLPQFAGTNIVLATKPSIGSFGFAYLVNSSTGAVQNVFSNLTDLSVLASPSGKNILAYSSQNNGDFFVQSINGSASVQLSPVTVPEKCVFDQNDASVAFCAVPTNGIAAGDLDNWYLGTLSFSDNIWKYDLTTGTASMIENLSNDSGRSIDAVNLQLNSASSLLIFQSKTDGSLWSLNVSGL